MLISGHLQTVKILISHYHATARISTSLRERQQLRVHFTQHVSSVERPRARMSAKFFPEIKHGQKQLQTSHVNLYMPVENCLALTVFPLVSIAYSRNKVC